MCVQVRKEISKSRSYGNTVVGGDTGVVLCLCGGDTVAIFYLIVVFVCFGTDGALKVQRHRSEQQQRTSGVFLWLCYIVSSSLRERLRCIAFSALSVVFMCMCNGSSDSTQLYTDVIRISMILRCTLVQ